MSIRTIFTWFSISFLVCSYPPLLHWVLPHSFSSSFRLSKLIADVLVAHHGQEEEIQVCDQAAIMSHKVKLKIISCPDFCEDVTTQCFKVIGRVLVTVQSKPIFVTSPFVERLPMLVSCLYQWWSSPTNSANCQPILPIQLFQPKKQCLIHLFQVYVQQSPGFPVFFF